MKRSGKTSVRNVAGRAARAGALTGLAGTGLAAAGAAVAWQRLARRPLPKTRGRIELAGLDGRVTVRRDRWGVPHVEATSREDLYFAEGFCHAQDRLWQMDFYRRVVSGRVAEMAGPEALKIDRLMLTLGVRRAAEREVLELDPEVRAMLERFCAGINAGAAVAPAPPLEMQILRLGPFAPWSPVDILSLGKLLAFGLSTNWERELVRADMVRELGPELTARLDPTYPRENPIVNQEIWSGDGVAIAGQIDAVRRALGLAAEASGSNNWAVSGARSATGSPLVAGDPHLPQSMPGIWYEIELRQGARFVRGASLPGMPGIYMGQNNDVAWTITNVMADVQDLFIERIEGEGVHLRGRAAAARGARGGDPRQGSLRAGPPDRARDPTTGRSSTRRSGPTRPSRWRWPGRRSPKRRRLPGCTRCSTSPRGPVWWRSSRATRRRPRT